MLAHAAVRFSGRTFGDPVPHGARSTQLGDGEELVGAGRKPESDPGSRVRQVQPGVGERTQVGHASGDRRTQFLRFGAAGLVHGGAVGDNETQLGPGGGERGSETRGRGQVGPLPSAGSDSQRSMPRLPETTLSGRFRLA